MRRIPSLLRWWPWLLAATLSPLTAQAVPPEGRLLASNCFQCHGTSGKGPGFERLAGLPAAEILAELLKTDPAAKAEWDRDQKLTNDPRITPVGAFLRKTSLDELPQLFNVLKGEMALVGPRPPLAAEVKLYQDWHMKRLEVAPGVTGLWQVSGRNRTSFAERAGWDADYIRNWTFWLDAAILLRTLGVILRGDGAY